MEGGIIKSSLLGGRKAQWRQKMYFIYLYSASFIFHVNIQMVRSPFDVHNPYKRLFVTQSMRRALVPKAILTGYSLVTRA